MGRARLQMPLISHWACMSRGTAQTWSKQGLKLTNKSTCALQQGDAVGYVAEPSACQHVSLGLEQPVRQVGSMSWCVVCGVCRSMAVAGGCSPPGLPADVCHHWGVFCGHLQIHDWPWGQPGCAAGEQTAEGNILYDMQTGTATVLQHGCSAERSWQVSVKGGVVGHQKHGVASLWNLPSRPGHSLATFDWS